MIGWVQPGTRHIGADDRLAEDHAAQDVADRPVWRAPHLLKLELLNAGLVRSDRRAFDPDAIFLDGVGGVDRDLVVCRIAMLDAEVVVLEWDIEIRKDQLVFDRLPDDPCHLVAIEFDDRIGDFDLRHLRLLNGSDFRAAYSTKSAREQCARRQMLARLLVSNVNDRAGGRH
jgi:hypothetical protein